MRATWTYILSISVSLCSVVGPAAADSPGGSSERHDLARALGVTTSHSSYGFTERNDLAEAAARIRDLGSKSIKVWFTRLNEAYPKTAWPEVSSLAEMAKTPAFKKLFRDDFETYILVAFSVGMDHTHWRTKPSAESLEADERQFYDLTRHLLATYGGTNKTFVLQNWEGDWAIRGTYDAKTPIDPVRFGQMAEWLNARQRGVDRARAEAGDVAGVRVLCAAEVNQVRSSLDGAVGGGGNVIDEVIPHTNVDLVSYSCYDAARDARTLRAALEHVASKIQPKPGMTGCRVYVGEYGLGENSAGLEKVRETIPMTVDVALGFGCPYVMYWQLYCNEPKRRPVIANEDVRGMWLIKPDGTKAWTWQYLHDRINGSTRTDKSGRKGSSAVSGPGATSGSELIVVP